MNHQIAQYSAGVRPVAHYDSSYEIISVPSSSEPSLVSYSPNNDTDDEDEIVWSISSDSIASSIPVTLLLEDDYVILNTRTSRVAPLNSETNTSFPNDLAERIIQLSISGDNSQAPEVPQDVVAKPKYRRRKLQDTSKPKPTTKSSQKPVKFSDNLPSTLPAPKDSGLSFCARSIVDDVSDGMSTMSDTESVVPSVYEEAVNCVTLFLSNPSQRQVNSLTFLQSLIIELGLAAPAMPHSLTSARAILKSSAFVNIREYLAVRGEGLAAIQRVMYPSKHALIKDIKRSRGKDKTPLPWVKRNGLQVLLVSCYH